MKLGNYLDQNGITQVDFAARIGCSDASVSRMIRGLQKPQLDLLLAIERETGGQVLARDFAPDESEAAA